MPNQLVNEKSLYLRQHADNPVNWYPWGEEALAKAKAEDKPILVSIGYSSCHWCHVMEHESFENQYIAQLMNEHFICIKVDREERPDVDQIYMEAVQMITQRGGWPLNVFCLPDGRPFFGGTYFPPEDRGNGMVPGPRFSYGYPNFLNATATNWRKTPKISSRTWMHPAPPLPPPTAPLTGTCCSIPARNLRGVTTTTTAASARRLNSLPPWPSTT